MKHLRLRPVAVRLLFLALLLAMPGLPGAVMAQSAMAKPRLTVASHPSAAANGSRPAPTGKLSPLVRRALTEAQTGRTSKVAARDDRRLTAFVRCEGGAGVLTDNGCEVLATFGDIHIAAIPLSRLGALAVSDRVLRIEAGGRCSVTMDSVPRQLNALPVYAGENLPQAFTGKGVVMGVQDIGFDLTHPNFYSRDLTDYRIRAFWDQLSADTTGSTLYVGRDYTTRDELLALGHARDGLDQTHGTHTLGIAAGSGYTSPYRGMAYESDICIVANATGDDADLIDDADLYKYTTATDALGFKYIFDYAGAHGQPCVISFSEGYHPDMYGDDLLFYAVLDSLTGPGRILVASAGNEGIYKSYFHKPAGTPSMGGFLYNSTASTACLLRSSDFFDLRIVAYGTPNDTLVVPSRLAYEAPDSQYVDTLWLSNGFWLTVQMAGYPSCYDASQQAYELVVSTPWQSMGSVTPVSMEVMGEGVDVEWFRYAGYLSSADLNPALNAGESNHNIHSPGAAPAVVCVGANSYRTGVTNHTGEWREYDQGTGGQISQYSSKGPTLDGRIKPDVVAPGTNVISSYSSYYLEHHADAYDILSDVEHFDFNGRTYAWNANSGTSMATPAVGGAIALWLQANPRLSPDDVKAILSRTAIHYDASPDWPNNDYGYGQIDVYAGLLDALGLAAGIPSLSHRQPDGVRFALCADGLSLRLAEPASRALTVRVYSAGGRQLLVRTFAPGQDAYTLSLQGLPTGVLAVQVDGGTAPTTGSTLIRR